MRATWLHDLPLAALPRWPPGVVAAVCVGGATLLRLALTPLLGAAIPFITYFPAILIATVWAGGRIGLSVLVIGSLIAAYAWLNPVWSVQLTPMSWAAVGAFWVFGGVLLSIALVLRDLIEAQAQAKTRALLMAHEMKHRVSNVLGVVLAISQQTARHAASVEEHQALFAARIQALAQAQTLVGEHGDRPLDLRSLLERMLAPFEGSRVELQGPATSVGPQTATSLALLIHELGTNAVKHGAWSVPSGRVLIHWVQSGTPPVRTRLEWREADGPPVLAPTRNGFGTRLLQTALTPESGEAAISFDPAGVSCVMCFADAGPMGAQTPSQA